MDHNPFLKPWRQSKPNEVAGKGRIERPGDAHNIVWQTRAAPPSEYEIQLGDALESIFAAGIEDLPGVIGRLNAQGVRDPGGDIWTEESFQREIRRLGK